MNKRKTGFTVVGVASVVAAVGLICAGAFVIMPAIQSSQRDSARESNVADFAAKIKSYQADVGRGALPITSGNYEYFTFQSARDGVDATPSSWQNFIKSYVDQDFKDPSGNDYGVYILKCVDTSGGEISTGQPCKSSGGALNFYDTINNVDAPVFSTKNPALYVSVGATCNGNTVVRTNSSRSFAVVQVLERGGKSCQSS